MFPHSDPHPFLNATPNEHRPIAGFTPHNIVSWYPVPGVLRLSHLSIGPFGLKKAAWFKWPDALRISQGRSPKANLKGTPWKTSGQQGPFEVQCGHALERFD